MKLIHPLALCAVASLLASLQSGFAAGVVTNCDQASLEAALADGGTVRFECDATIYLTNTITIGANTVLDANGHAVTLSGSNARRLFVFEAGTSNVLSGLILRDGFAGSNEHGGAIFNAGNLTLSNCVVATNRTMHGRGGAVYNTGNLTCLGSQFTGNSAFGGDGINGTTNSAATGGGAGLGGAVYSTTGQVVVTDCQFVSNQAVAGNGGSGWTWYYSAPSGWDYPGGAGESFDGVGGTGSGAGGPTRSYYFIDTLQISGGSGGGGAAFGGAIFLEDGGLFCHGSSFSNNVAEGGGGAQNGRAFGGAIFSQGAAELSLCLLEGNLATDRSGATINAGPAGGALAALAGSLSLHQCTVSSNQVTGALREDSQGGGLWFDQAVVAIEQSGFYGNRAVAGNGASSYPPREAYAGGNARGGGVYVGPLATLALTNVTLSANEAKGGAGVIANLAIAPGTDAFGGGLFNQGASTLVNVTIASNLVTEGSGKDVGGGVPPAPPGFARGGGFDHTAGSLVLLNTLVAGNSASDDSPDGAGAVSSAGYNLIGNASGITGLATSDWTNVNANLAPLQDNGGPTWTHDFAGPSFALDRATAAGAPPVDQRGVTRPRGAGFDIGAVESQIVPSGSADEFSFSLSSYSMAEGNVAEITVLRRNSTTNQVSVDFAAGGGTAQAGADYFATNATLTFHPGQTSQVVRITIAFDGWGEGDETVELALSNPSLGATLAISQAVLTIHDQPAAQFFGLGLGTRANGVSANGRFVAGGITNAAYPWLPYRWTSGQREILPLPAESTEGSASKISADGETAVGSHLRMYSTPVLWSDGAEPVSLGGRGIYSDVSADGNYWVGGAWVPDLSLSQAYRWPVPGNLGALTDDYYRRALAYGISADGSVVVGVSRSTNTPDAPFGMGEAFRWTSNGMVGLGFLPFTTNSIATAVSGNGLVVVGSSGEQGFRWTEGGGMVGLGNFAPKAVNHDGTMVVGQGDVGSGQEAVLWDSTNGLRSLRSVLELHGVDVGGWVLTVINDISADGTVLVGDGFNSSGLMEGWLVNLASTDYSRSWLQPPTGLSAAPWSASDLRISWQTVTNATGYKLQRKEGTNSWVTIGLFGATTTNYVDSYSGLPRFYRIAATNQIDVSLYAMLEIASGTFSFSATSYSAAENDVAVLITVTRTDGTNGEASVNFAMADGTAVAGQDYISTNGTLFFAAGQTNATFSVRPLRDLLTEADETVFLELSGPSVGTTLGVISNATLIIHNSGAQELSLQSPSTALDENAGSVVVTVVRSNGSSGTVTVQFQTADGTALSGVDYLATNGTLHFAEGESTKSFLVSVLDDGLLEANETFTVWLSHPQGAVLISPTNSVVTIQDDEVELGFSAANYSVHEASGHATVTLVRTGRTNGSVNVHFHTGDQTATAGVDYSQTEATLVFSEGESEKLVLVPVASDLLTEGAETVGLFLSNPSGAVLVASNAVLTIFDLGAAEGDMDQDGKTDVVFQHEDRRLGVWRMDGTNFLGGQSWQFTTMPERSFRLIGLANFNKDNAVDHILRNAAEVWVSTGSFFHLRWLRNIDSQWAFVGCGDMDGDREADLVWQHLDGRLLAWRLNQFSFLGATWLRNGQPAGPGWRARGVADFNGDGHTDLLFHHTDRRLAVWFMNQTNWSSSALLNDGRSSAPGWTLVGLNDLNNDTQADLLWQNTDGQLAVKFMHQTNIVGGSLVREGTPVNPGWRVVGVR